MMKKSGLYFRAGSLESLLEALLSQIRICFETVAAESLLFQWGSVFIGPRNMFSSFHNFLRR
ncbi:hypothetical protein [Aeribacillus composti]|uniref:hypothetical protein n=1 Tax=Aeribacillus composti TaxID=1868734 RepID=UPI003D262876